MHIWKNDPWHKRWLHRTSRVRGRAGISLDLVLPILALLLPIVASALLPAGSAKSQNITGDPGVVPLPQPPVLLYTTKKSQSISGVHVVVRFDAARAPSRASYEVTVDHKTLPSIAAVRIECGQGAEAIRPVTAVEATAWQSKYLVTDACTRTSNGTASERVSIRDSNGVEIASSNPMSVKFPPTRVAFLGATGYGALAQVGGAVGGSTVCRVTNTNDSGAGSFRDCVGGSNRIVVLTIGGTAHLTSELLIPANNLLISGNKTPGGGFAVSRGLRPTWANTLRVTGDDQVYRNFRVRHREAANPTEGDAINIKIGSDRWIGDHLSLTWGDDQTWSTNGRDVTLQFSLIAETCNNAEGANNLMLDVGHNTTWHRNVGAVATHRFPNVSTSEMHDYVNNVFYTVDIVNQPPADFGDCDPDGLNDDLPMHANMVGNVWRAKDGAPAPHLLNIYKQTNCRESPYLPGWGCMGLGVYARWNQGWDAAGKPRDPLASQVPLFSCSELGDVATGDIGCDGDNKWSYWDRCTSPTQYTSDSEYPVGRILEATLGTNELETEVLAQAGAFPRDGIDTCIIYKVVQRTGVEVLNRAAGCKGGTATLAPGVWCSAEGGDTDADGMCDDFETTYLGGISAVNTADPDADGFLNIEEFLQDSNPTVFDPSPQAF